MKRLVPFFILFIALWGCEKYQSVLIEGSDYQPGSSWVGNQNFFARVEGDNLQLLFYSPGPAPFFEYKIGNGAWSSPIAQSAWLADHWGSGSISLGSIPPGELVSIRFGNETEYANIEGSMFDVGGILVFGLVDIQH